MVSHYVASSISFMSYKRGDPMSWSERYNFMNPLWSLHAAKVFPPLPLSNKSRFDPHSIHCFGFKPSGKPPILPTLPLEWFACVWRHCGWCSRADLWIIQFGTWARLMFCICSGTVESCSGEGGSHITCRHCFIYASCMDFVLVLVPACCGRSRCVLVWLFVTCWFYTLSVCSCLFFFLIYFSATRFVFHLIYVQFSSAVVAAQNIWEWAHILPFGLLFV